MAVRADLVEAHRLAWEHLASPGAWWSGRQRVELARTAIAALADPDPLPPWASVSAFTGRVPNDRTAPAVAHDVVYRLSRHAGTITQDFYRDVSAELGELPYVELVGLASTVAAVDRFHRNVGAAPPPLPEPMSGEPSNEVPANVIIPELNWVPVVGPADQSAAVVQAYTAVPAEDHNLWRLAAAQYIPADEMGDPDWRRSDAGLSRPQAELVAARVSQLRECFY